MSVMDYQQYVSSHPSVLSDLPFTLGAKREHLPHRAFCVTDGKAPLVISPFARSKSSKQINFVFTGQGAQWAGMGRELMQEFAEFHEDIKAMDRVLAGLSDRRSWTIEGT